MENNKIINLLYDIEYNNYEIFIIDEITKQYDIIYDIFDEILNENIVKLYILKKKKKLDGDIIIYIDIIFELINNLKNTKNINKQNFLEIIILLIQIISIIPNLLDLLNKTNYNKLINTQLLNTKFNLLIEKLSEKNLLLYYLKKLLLKNDSSVNKQIISSIAKILACDYFLIYNPNDILNLINKKLKNNIIFNIFLKYKKKFIIEYNELCSKYNELYSDVNFNNNNKHFYHIKNIIFLDMINDILLINQNL